MTMPKHPSEVFGFPVEDRSATAEASRARFWCPFQDQVCGKQSRLIEYPMGVCSVQWNQEVIALCPKRLLQDIAVFKDVADHYFGARHDLLIFPEIAVRDVGTFDYVMVKHKPLSSDIEDFVVIEFQTGQTSNTGRLVQALEDFIQGQDMTGRTYGFGLNLYDIWKRTFTQILTKGVALENWGQKVYWVVQEPIYRYFAKRYGLTDLGFNPSDSTRFAIYTMERVGQNYQLVQAAIKSSSVDNLFRAFRENVQTPSKDRFVEVLQAKIRAQLQLQLDLSR
jgi:hypothetical protein